MSQAAPFGNGVGYVVRAAVLFGILAGMPPAGGEVSSVDAPRISFAETNYDFGRVMAGEVVEHAFVFTNTGNRELQLTGVVTSCDCVHVGDWTRRVGPGQTGRVEIRLDTVGIKLLAERNVLVNCNDPRQPSSRLGMKGLVWRALGIEPSVALLQLNPDAPLGTAMVWITNRTEAPVTLSGLESSNRVIGAEFRTNLPGRLFSLMISNTTPLATNCQSLLTLRTSIRRLPMARVFVLANVQPRCSIMPTQIVLAPLPLGANKLAYVTILNHSTNQLRLSDPVVEPGGAQVDLCETKTGMAFTATVTFPAGFDLPHGELAWFRVKTSDPERPLIEVPIRRELPATLPKVPDPKPSVMP